MQLDLYKNSFDAYFSKPELNQQISQCVELLNAKPRIFFIGNGGSNSICSHMYEDFGKMGRFETFAFSDAALITCYANDYGYENSLAEWLKLYFKPNDLLIAVSSSGNSPNIVNAVNIAKEFGGKIITLSGFNSTNKISEAGEVNFHVPHHSYGIVECFHQLILHIVLDEYLAQV